MPKAAIYARISQDRNGDGAGTDRQEKDCRALCRREGLTVARVFVDDDRSAYNGKARPAFEELLASLDQFDALVCWKTDRLVRRWSQFGQVVDACERTGVRLVSVTDAIDTSTPMGKGAAGLLAAVGEQESANISTRVTRKDAENATNGRPHGGRRAFGYKPDGVTVVAKEARAIREARDRVLVGESLTGICRDWNRRGVRPTSAAAWRVGAFKKMVTSPRIAGLRQYHGEPVGPATWPGIITPEERDRIVAVLSDPRVHRRGRPPSYLLTGLVRCGRCGGTLQRGVRAAGEPKWACCRKPGDEHRCGRCTVAADHVDALVEEALLVRLDSPALRKALRRKKPRKGARPDAVAVVADLERRVTQLGVDHDEGLLSRREWLDRRARLTDRLDAARAELVPERDDTEALDAFAGVDVRERWAGLPLDARRAVARAVIAEVVVLPPFKGTNRFDPNRVDVAWRV
jgi:site-specific DNA recombinase